MENSNTVNNKNYLYNYTYKFDNKSQNDIYEYLKVNKYDFNQLMYEALCILFKIFNFDNYKVGFIKKELFPQKDSVIPLNLNFKVINNINYVTRRVDEYFHNSNVQTDFVNLKALDVVINVRDSNDENDEAKELLNSFRGKLLININLSENINVIINYDSNLYSENIINSMTIYLKEIIKHIIKMNNIIIRNIVINNEKDSIKLLNLFNKTENKFNYNDTLDKLFYRQVYKNLDKVAIVCGAESLTYRSLNEKSNQFANLLIKKGVVQGSFIGLMVERSLDMIVAIVGILKVGAAYLPIDFQFPLNRIKYMLSSSNASLIITNRNMPNIFEGETIYLEDHEYYLENSEDLPVINKPNSIAYVIFTSGSTGNPKGVLIEHKSVVNVINSIYDKLKITKYHSILALTTISFDISVVEILLPITKGIKVYLVGNNNESNPKVISDIIESNNIDVLQVTPSRLQLVQTYDPNLNCLKNIKVIMVGGEQFPENLLKLLKEKSGAQIYNMYGPTETTVWSTMKNLTNTNEINIGKPINNTQVWIVDENNKLQLFGEKGEICISGYGLSRGYINDVQKTNEKFIKIDNLENKILVYKTGDIGIYLPNGDIECLGRLDNQVKLRGYRIELEEIESTLLKNPDIKQAVVKVKDEHLIAYISTKARVDTEQIKHYLKLYLPQYMVPARYVELDKIELTPNGKTDRNSIKINYEENHKAETEILTNPYESRIKNIIKNACEQDFPIGTVNLDGSWEDLGLDSILFIKIVLSIETEFNIEFDDDYLVFSKFKTLNDFISYVSDLISK